HEKGGDEGGERICAPRSSAAAAGVGRLPGSAPLARGPTPQAMGGQQRRQRQRRELREARKGGERAPRRRRGGEEQRREHQHGHKSVVGVALQGVQGERVGDPRVGQRDPQRGSAHASAEQEDQREREQVEGDRGGVGGGQVVPGAAPAEDLL